MLASIQVTEDPRMCWLLLRRGVRLCHCSLYDITMVRDPEMDYSETWF